MGPYTEGVRIGSGEALAIARPGSLLEIWEVLGLCTQAQVAIANVQRNAKYLKPI